MGRNAAGKDGKERLAGSVLEQIPFLQNCEDEDSDEDDELDSVQHKKQRVKVGPMACLGGSQGRPGPFTPAACHTPWPARASWRGCSASSRGRMLSEPY